jgi:hypothetical protein
LNWYNNKDDNNKIDKIIGELKTKLRKIIDDLENVQHALGLDETEP